MTDLWLTSPHWGYINPRLKLTVNTKRSNGEPKSELEMCRELGIKQCSINVDLEKPTTEKRGRGRVQQKAKCHHCQQWFDSTSELMAHAAQYIKCHLCPPNRNIFCSMEMTKKHFQYQHTKMMMEMSLGKPMTNQAPKNPAPRIKCIVRHPPKGGWTKPNILRKNKLRQILPKPPSPKKTKSLLLDDDDGLLDEVPLNELLKFKSLS